MAAAAAAAAATVAPPPPPQRPPMTREETRQVSWPWPGHTENSWAPPHPHPQQQTRSANAPRLVEGGNSPAAAGLGKLQGSHGADGRPAREAATVRAVGRCDRRQQHQEPRDHRQGHHHQPQQHGLARPAAGPAGTTAPASTFRTATVSITIALALTVVLNIAAGRQHIVGAQTDLGPASPENAPPYGPNAAARR